MFGVHLCAQPSLPHGFLAMLGYGLPIFRSTRTHICGQGCGVLWCAAALTASELPPQTLQLLAVSWFKFSSFVYAVLSSNTLLKQFSVCEFTYISFGDETRICSSASISNSLSCGLWCTQACLIKAYCMAMHFSSGLSTQLSSFQSDSFCTPTSSVLGQLDSVCEPSESSIYNQ